MAGQSLLDTMRPFTNAQAEEAGIHHRELGGTAYRRLLPGVYVSAQVPDTVVVRARAALLLAPEKGFVSHVTAGRLWGATHLKDPRIHLAYHGDVRCRADGVLTHRFRQPFATTHRHGLPVTTPEQTFVHCAVRTDLLDLVALGDRLLKREPVSITSIDGLAGFVQGWNGQGRANALRAIPFIRTQVDSVQETYLRLLIVLAGLPEPTVNLRLNHPDGTLRYRLDLAYAANLLAIEYDGRWHEDPEQTLRDLARRQELAEEGWRIEVVRTDDLYRTPELTLARLSQAMRERDVPVPRRTSDTWRRYFVDHLGTVA